MLVRSIPLHSLLGALLLPVVAHAEAAPAVTLPSSGPHAYAIMVGRNEGGAGQPPLRYAEKDVEQMTAVLRELGRFDSKDIRVLDHPDPARVLAVIDEVGRLVRADAGRGESTQVFFYFSGHARAQAVNLAGEELPLTVLREHLQALPAALTIVVLDACQSGAFARAKGSEAAADFSYNSISKLTQKGLAVMASSSSQELSQESDELGASYFTHYLVTGLRGAADADGDGRVSLDEAYRYAYRRTLASTARTQLGEQHVTLETDLAGQGDLPVTYPAAARAQLELPGPLDARVLVQHRASGAVMAEVQKAAGSAVRLAFVAGTYNGLVGEGSSVFQCRLTLADDKVTILDTSSCARVETDAASPKGEEADHPRRAIERWGLEAATGLSWHQTDAFTDRLDEFGYQHQKSLLHLPTARLAIGISRTLAPHLAALVQLSTLAGDVYERTIAGSTDTATMHGYGGALLLRASADLVGEWLAIYGQAGVGMSLGVLTYRTQQSGVPPSTTDVSTGYLVAGAAGVSVRPWQRIGFFLQGGYDRAPAITNLIGDTHDSGGVSAVLGARVALGTGESP